MKNQILQFTVKHPVLAFIIGIGLFTAVSVFILLAIQSPLQRERNIKALMTNLLPPQYNLYVSTGDKATFMAQDFSEREVKKFNSENALNKQIKYVLLTGQGGNAFLLHTNHKDFQYLWINAGFDHGVLTTAEQILPSSVRQPGTMILTEADWKFSWGLRHFKPGRLYSLPGMDKRLRETDPPFWNKFGLPAAITPVHDSMQSIYWQGLEVRLIKINGGNKKESLVVYFPEEKILYTGTTTFVYHLPRLENDGSLTTLKDGLNALNALPFINEVYLFIPGYGPPFGQVQFKRYGTFLNRLEKRIDELNTTAAQETSDKAERIQYIIDNFNLDGWFPGKRDIGGSLKMLVSARVEQGL